MVCPCEAGVWAAITIEGPKQYYNSKPQVDGIKAFLDHCVVFAWQGFGRGGGYSSGFHEVLPEASSTSGRANVSRLQDGPRPAKVKQS